MYIHLSSGWCSQGVGRVCPIHLLSLILLSVEEEEGSSLLRLPSSLSPPRSVHPEHTLSVCLDVMRVTEVLYSAQNKNISKKELYLEHTHGFHS